MEDILKRLEMRVAGSGNVMEVLPPSVRQDLRAEEDIVEEIARIYGYDRLETTLPRGNSTAGMPAARGLTEFARDVLSGAGYSEIQTYSFARLESAEWLNVPEGAEERRFVRILNPLGDENSAMRTMLLPNMLETLGRNCARNIEAARAYEIGGVFFRASGEELPEERRSMAVGAYGGNIDFYELKGVMEILFGAMGVRDVSYEAESGNAAFHPGRCARISRGGGILGVMGELHPDVAEKYGICARSYVCELDFGAVIAGADTMSYYKPLPKYPAVFRDVALLVDERVTVKSIETVIKMAAGKNLESLSLFDVYRGEQVPGGMKSAAFNLVYRSPERTLTDEEAAEDCERVLDALRRELNAVLREV
jgi:phenylalanyl-tRNA synthetase beta chain